MARSGDGRIETCLSGHQSDKQAQESRSIRLLWFLPANIAAKALPDAGNAGAFAALSAAEALFSARRMAGIEAAMSSSNTRVML